MVGPCAEDKISWHSETRTKEKCADKSIALLIFIRNFSTLRFSSNDARPSEKRSSHTLCAKCTWEPIYSEYDLSESEESIDNKFLFHKSSCWSPISLTHNVFFRNARTSTIKIQKRTISRKTNENSVPKETISGLKIALSCAMMVNACTTKWCSSSLPDHTGSNKEQSPSSRLLNVKKRTKYSNILGQWKRSGFKVK